MELALYDADHGYYEAESRFADPLGREGDFITAADLGPWAAVAFTDLIVWSWQQLGEPAEWALVEQGGGSGRLLIDTLSRLAQQELPQPTTYSVERSAALRQRQQQLYATHGVTIHQHGSMEQLPQLDAAVLISNELPDAFPVRRFIHRDGVMYEQLVAWSGTDFVWQESDKPLQHAPDIPQSICNRWPNNYQSEWSDALSPWLNGCAAVANRSLLICVDYGFSQLEYYRPERSSGTLMGHRAHQVVERVLAHAGECDITSHVDFTALRNSAEGAGFQVVAFMPQWAWLAQSPSVQQEMVRRAADSSIASIQAVAHAKRLMLPQGMGESFKLLIATNSITPSTPDYLTPFNMLDRL
ncbi:MAG: SAM-dependent methyltransferase, partial [Mariprofundales bacterium]|nr:SAM-dependent methyltransferase [Mariprofundales bacterium]